VHYFLLNEMSAVWNSLGIGIVCKKERPSMTNQWSKWWWVRLDLIPIWSPDERRAAGVFCGVLLATLLIVGAVLNFYISRLKFDPAVTLIASLGFSLLVVIPSLRGLATRIFPATLKSGDEAAAQRAGGEVILPEKSPGLWWINYGAGTNMISRDEQFIRVAIFAIAMLIFCPSALYFPSHLMIWLDVSKRTSIIATLVTMLPLSFLVGRKLSVWLWPDVARKADENALARFNHRELARQD
jgi:hypothetical protein